MESKIRKYDGGAVRVLYDMKRCIHAAECVKGLPAVFDTDRRLWIDPDRGDADEIAQVVLRCPTGALRFERLDGGTEEQAAAQNTVRVSADGPLYLQGDIEVVDAAGAILLRDTRVALCRCGASGNKPLCDGRHARAGFEDAGTVTMGAGEDEPGEGGKLTVALAANGPVILRGVHCVIDAAGQPAPRRSKAAMCRCGGSANKPFCDGTHADIGFEAGETRRMHNA
jgi:CDGSH-type Zn-finger protein/uncharacterized Fe-S cluster protein YjdI